jgi:5-methylcytosine-specific restriction enzyme A
MVKFTDLTDPAAVAGAVAEFRRLGRAGFLNRYGLEPSRDYFLRDGDELFDSTTDLAAAFARQFPDRPALKPRDFSGGATATVQALQRLGYVVITRAQLSPPTLGEEFASRTAIYERYGGDKVAGIIKFLGEDVVQRVLRRPGPLRPRSTVLGGVVRVPR